MLGPHKRLPRFRIGWDLTPICLQFLILNLFLTAENLTANCIDQKYNLPEASRLAYAIHLFISQLWTNKFSSLRTDHIRNAMKEYGKTTAWLSKTAETFSLGYQEDSQEFAALVIDVLHRAYNTSSLTIEPSSISKVKGRKYESIQEYKARVRQQNASIIFDCFFFFSGKQIQCTKCGDVCYDKLD